MRITRAVVPSLFTILNIVCGFMSIIHASRGEYAQSAWFIIIAGVFDSLDGVMARITKSSSDFGVELDSLCDVVSFGVAPSFLVYNIHLHALDGVGVLISAMPMVFGAMRLARFNVQLVGYDKEYFKGLPIPSQAIAVCAFILTYYREPDGLGEVESSMIAPLVVILSLLMVSRIRYDTLPKFTKRGIAQHPVRFTIVVIAATAIVFTAGRALFPCFVIYIAAGPVRYMVDFIRHAFHPAGKSAESDEPEISSVNV